MSQLDTALNFWQQIGPSRSSALVVFSVWAIELNVIRRYFGLQIHHAPLTSSVDKTLMASWICPPRFSVMVTGLFLSNEIVARTRYGRVHTQELWTQFAFTSVLLSISTDRFTDILQSNDWQVWIYHMRLLRHVIKKGQKRFGKSYTYPTAFIVASDYLSWYHTHFLLSIEGR